MTTFAVALLALFVVAVRPLMVGPRWPEAGTVSAACGLAAYGVAVLGALWSVTP